MITTRYGKDRPFAPDYDGCSRNDVRRTRSQPGPFHLSTPNSPFNPSLRAQFTTRITQNSHLIPKKTKSHIHTPIHNGTPTLQYPLLRQPRRKTSLHHHRPSPHPHTHPRPPHPLPRRPQALRRLGGDTVRHQCRDLCRRPLL